MDASKVFDRVNHNLLFMKLLDRNVPFLTASVLHMWYVYKSVFFVKRGSVMSQSFNVSRGVMLGSILSPILFNMYIDSFQECKTWVSACRMSY